MNTRRGTLFIAACAALLCGACRPSWSITGVLVGEVVSSPTGLVVHRAVKDATVSFQCPHEEQKAQKVSTSNGTFAFHGSDSTFPLACTLQVGAPGYASSTADFAATCDSPAGSLCEKATLALELVAPPRTSPLPLVSSAARPAPPDALPSASVAASAPEPSTPEPSASAAKPPSKPSPAASRYRHRGGDIGF